MILARFNLESIGLSLVYYIFKKILLTKVRLCVVFTKNIMKKSKKNLIYIKLIITLDPEKNELFFSG